MGHQFSGGVGADSGSSSDGKRESNFSILESRFSSLSSLSVSCTFLPAISMKVLQLAGASLWVCMAGATACSDCVGASTGSFWGCTCGCSVAGGVVPLLWSCSSLVLASVRLRFIKPAAIRCLHQKLGAFG